MAQTALQVAAAAYKNAKVDQPLESFTMDEFPYDSALEIMNSAIADLNRMGNFSFAETDLVLPYTPGSMSFNLNTVGPSVIEQRRITRIRREADGHTGELTEVSYRDFQKRYRISPVPTQKPSYWSKYKGLIYLNSIPDQDYILTLYHYQQIQPIVIGVNDNLPTIVPEYNIDVLRDMTKALLLKEMGRPDFANQYTLADKKARSLLARSNEDAGMPTQLPRAF